MTSNGASSSFQNQSLIRLATQRLKQIATHDVSPSLKEKVSSALLDYLGAIGSGLQAPWASHLCSFGQIRKSEPESHAWGVQQDISAERAAFVNAALAHSAIRDDMHLKSNSHIGSMVISAALALAQRDNWTGEQLLKAIIGGYEVASLLGVAVQQSPGYNRHFRPSGIVGAFGSAGAAITANFVSSQLQDETAINALAFAANMSSGFNEWAWAGGLEIYTEMGAASQAGIVAFDLARAGMQCSETLLEGKAGLFAALAASEGEQLFRDQLKGELGQGIMAVRFKPVPGCNYAQTPLAVALKLARKQKLEYNDIQNVTVTCTGGAKNYPGCNNPGPFSNVQQTKMSIQFGVCAVLLYGEVSESLFQKFDDKNVATLTSDCILQSTDEFDREFKEGYQPARVEVKFTDSTSLKEEFADVPWLSADEVIERFHSELEIHKMSETSRKRLISLSQELQEMKDLSEVLELFREATPLQNH